MEPLQIVAATPPVEATIRILLNSVPYLIGAAVVRQPAGPDVVAADVGRNPWLFDRRLTSLELPDDALPANRAVALDWPVPYQAEWVGVPPRLLISRLVFAGRTVGVLLGTLITREQLGAQTREAIDLSCELIASAVAMDSPAMYVAPEPQIRVPEIAVSPQSPRTLSPDPVVPPPSWASDPDLAHGQPSDPAVGSSSAPAHAAIPDTPDRSAAIVEEVRHAVAVAGDARAIGRVLRDAMNAVTAAAAFAVALFHADRPEVAYRYKVVGVDAASSELGRQPVDDGPGCDAVREGGRWRTFERDVVVGAEPQRVAVVQVPLREGVVPIGVVTVQTLRVGGFVQNELELIAQIVEATRAPLAEARAVGRFQPSSEPEFALPRPRTASAPRATSATPDPTAAWIAPPVAPAAPAAAPAPTRPVLSSEEILAGLLERFASAGAPTCFIVGLDVTAGMLCGEGTSGSPAAAELDTALGITSGRFAVSLDDRYNAIARACREARTITAPTVHEILQPVYEWSDALVLERLVGGGHSAILPIVVDGNVVGAVIAGPSFDPLETAILERLPAIVADAAQELAGAWRAASIGGAAGQVVADDARLRLLATRSVA
ncbi:MAG: hypothetical protein NVS1B1_06160 [Candidatus Limnocylindrales bacterium]